MHSHYSPLAVFVVVLVACLLLACASEGSPVASEGQVTAEIVLPPQSQWPSICKEFLASEILSGKSWIHDLSRGPFIIEADGQDHNVCLLGELPADLPFELSKDPVILEGPGDGSLVVYGMSSTIVGVRRGSGMGGVSAVGNSLGLAVATRKGSGHGFASCFGPVSCLASREDSGNGEAYAEAPEFTVIRDGQGKGNAVASWEAEGSVMLGDSGVIAEGLVTCQGSGYCDAILEGDITGMAIRSAFGPGCAYGPPSAELVDPKKFAEETC